MTNDKMTDSNRLTDLIARLRERHFAWEGAEQYGSLDEEAADAIEELMAALHNISIASQNSMSSKEECGRIARAALEVE